MAKRDPYIAIMVAAHSGRGVFLSADETWDLAQDDAIAAAAGNRLDEKDFHDRNGQPITRAKGWNTIICAACGSPRREHQPGGTRWGPMTLCGVFIPQQITETTK